jgi:hypothetical protein
MDVAMNHGAEDPSQLFLFTLLPNSKNEFVLIDSDVRFPNPKMPLLDELVRNILFCLHCFQPKNNFVLIDSDVRLPKPQMLL